jgi:hypothetical protein
VATPKRRRCSKCEVNRDVKFFVSDRGRVCKFCRRKNTRKNSRNTRLVNTYGITQEDYEWMIEQQGGVCYGCLGHRKVFDVDHDHKLEKAGVPIRHTVRGGLCRSDNKILAMAGDDPARLRRLADYLEKGVVWPL